MKLRGWLACAGVMVIGAAMSAPGTPDSSGTRETTRAEAVAASPDSTGGGGDGGATTGVASQTDLSGHWVWSSDRTQALTGAVPPKPQGPVEWTITETAETLTMARPWPVGPEHTFAFKLDGSESVNRVGATVYRTKLRRDGAKVVIEGSKVTAGADAVVTGTMRWVVWLTAGGDLVVESTTTMDPINGVTLQGGRDRPFVQVFVRTPRK
jgi:hypothetical protein